MQTNNFLHRVKVLAREGLHVGIKHFFLLSLSFEILLNVAMIVIILSSLGEITDLTSFPFLEFLGGVIIFNLTIWLWGVIPITTIGAIGGTLTGFILGFGKKKAPDVLACSVGALVGIVLILFANYMNWLSRSTNFHNHYSFWYYLIPLSTPKEASQYYLSVNPFFIPSVISVVMWLYVGWQINKRKDLEPAPS